MATVSEIIQWVTETVLNREPRPDEIPTETALAEWYPECPAEAKAEAARLLLALDCPEELQGSSGISHLDADELPQWQPDISIDASAIQGVLAATELCAAFEAAPKIKTLAAHVLSDTDAGLTSRTGAKHSVESAHRAWLGARQAEPSLLHPLLPLVHAWQTRPVRPSRATVTATNSDFRAVRRPELVSTVFRTDWSDAGSVVGATVDGEPLAARMVDLSDTFLRNTRPRRKAMKKPGDQGELLPTTTRGITKVMPELRMTALEGLPPIVAGDCATLMTLGHALDRPLRLTETEGAALLSRTRNGELRRPQESDRERFRQAAAALRAALIYDPYRPDSRFPDWREIMDIRRTASGRYLIGPPLWARELAASGQRWTLTAQGNCSTNRYKLAGEQSLAGRIVTGLEYRLYARWDGRAGQGPDMRPNTGKSGPGASVFVSWRECLALAGNWHDPTNAVADEAARQRFNRAFGALERHGYLLPNRDGSDGKKRPNFQGEADAGDTVEIIARKLAGPGRPGGLLIRASARFVEAAARANMDGGKGFESISLVDYAGKPHSLDSDEIN